MIQVVSLVAKLYKTALNEGHPPFQVPFKVGGPTKRLTEKYAEDWVPGAVPGVGVVLIAAILISQLL